MPSPIAHAGMGYVIYRLFRPRKGRQEPTLSKKQLLPLAATIGLSLLPDLDTVPGFLTGEFGRFHNTVTNSFAMGLIAALGVGAAVWLSRRSGFKRWFLIALVAYYMHVMMDYLTLGRGPMLLWPFTDERFDSPFKAFFGAHWSEGWISISHLWTALSELAFVAVLLLLVNVLSSRRSSPETAKVKAK